MTNPIFKWTGRKSRLLAKYEALNFFPDASQFDTFVDLFAGSGAVTCWVADRYPDKKLIFNDFNHEMMTMFEQLRDNWPEFSDCYKRLADKFIDTPIEERKALYNFYKCRYAYDYKKEGQAELAASLLVMMKINFNGMWKAYKKYDYRYSTPPGTVNYSPAIFSMQAVEQFREVLLRSTLLSQSFRDVIIPERSWVFADPPYRDCSVGYSDAFNDEDQHDLTTKLNECGSLFAESNKEVGDQFWDTRFPKEYIHFLDHKYTCGRGETVTAVTEVLIKNY
jgi:DNA adenine methylase Dam